jgi:type IV pilus assembly protein PilA
VLLRSGATSGKWEIGEIRFNIEDLITNKRRDNMKKSKKNNKGFSLVELIVVILIMAILAVALAPQVMKWVNNSRRASDVTTYESLVSSIQLALADEPTFRAVNSATVLVNLWEADQDSTAAEAYVTITSTTAGVATALENELNDVISNNYEVTTRAKVNAAHYLITVVNGEIQKTTPPTSVME